MLLHTNLSAKEACQVCSISRAAMHLKVQWENCMSQSDLVLERTVTLHLARVLSIAIAERVTFLQSNRSRGQYQVDNSC